MALAYSLFRWRMGLQVGMERGLVPCALSDCGRWHKGRGEQPPPPETGGTGERAPPCTFQGTSANAIPLPGVGRALTQGKWDFTPHIGRSGGGIPSYNHSPYHQAKRAWQEPGNREFHPRILPGDAR